MSNQAVDCFENQSGSSAALVVVTLSETLHLLETCIQGPKAIQAKSHF